MRKICNEPTNNLWKVFRILAEGCVIPEQSEENEKRKCNLMLQTLEQRIRTEETYETDKEEND